MTRTRTFALMAGMALVAAACGSGTDAGTEVTPAPTEATTQATAAPTESTTAPGAEGPGAVDVALADTSLGTVLVDGAGMTLYAFLNDTTGSSTCYDQCEQNWPPLLGEAAAGSGLDASLFGTTERTDGSLQVVYGDWPLYYFAADGAPGDVNGQGVGDVWYVVGADAAVITEAGGGGEAAAVPEGAITLADSSLGTILVDAEGMTLYGFTDDTAGISTCYDGCAAAWPPLSGDTPFDPNLLDSGLFRVIDRDDGTTQLAYGDWPLYYYAGDVAAGDVTGQNVGEVWFVVAPDASLILP